MYDAAPSQLPFRVERAPLADDRPIVFAAYGELDAASAPRLRELVERALPEGRPIIIDLIGCTFMDLAGARSLHGAANSARRAGQRLAVVCLDGGAPRRILGLSPDAGLMICPNRTSGLNRLSDRATRSPGAEGHGR